MITKEEYENALKIVRDFDLQERTREELEAKTIDKGLGKCMEKHCTSFAVVDYNGHGHWVCKYHDDKLNKEFEDEYN